MENSDTDSVSAESPFNGPVLFGVVAGVCGLWLLAVIITTKGCRKCGYNDETYVGGVWGQNESQAQQASDLQLAQQLQEEEDLEVTRVERERKAKARTAFVDKHLPAGTSYKDSLGDSINQQCAICLANYEKGDNLVSGTTNLCTHEFHRTCIAGWLLQRSGCPVCRQVFLKQDVKEERNEEEGADGDAAPSMPGEQTPADDDTETWC